MNIQEEMMMIEIKYEVRGFLGLVILQLCTPHLF